MIKLWMEMGHYSGDLVIQPKLIWRSGFNPDHKQRNTQHQNLGRSILPTPLSIGSIELLDIIRIISSPEIDRVQFPLVSKRNSFMIVTSRASFLLEALTSSEKEHVVSALKILVSRFVSMIACQETYLIDEFFLPAGVVLG